MRRENLLSAFLSVLFERISLLTTEGLVMFARIPSQELRTIKVDHLLIEEGRMEGEAPGTSTESATVMLRQLNRCCGALTEETGRLHHGRAAGAAGGPG